MTETQVELIRLLAVTRNILTEGVRLLTVKNKILNNDDFLTSYVSGYRCL